MDLQRVTDLLVATWVVSQGRGVNLPAGYGKLDQALATAISQGAFAGEFEELTFTDTPLGVRCSELAGILDLASATLMIRTPNPTYEAASIAISESAAVAILDELRVPIPSAKAWGDLLAQALTDSRSQT